jgi:hypothetical protein
MVPGNAAGFGGEVIIGRKLRLKPQLSVVFPNGQTPKKLSASARYGGFSHKPWAPWFQEESWKMA